VLLKAQREVFSKPRQVVQQRAALTRSNLEASNAFAVPKRFHGQKPASCTSSTAVGTDCSASTVEVYEVKRADRPWSIAVSEDGVSRSCNISVIDVEEQEEDAQDFPVPDNWEDANLDELDKVLERRAILEGSGSTIVSCNASVVDVEEQMQLPVSKQDAQDQCAVPDNWEDADLDVLDEVLQDQFSVPDTRGNALNNASKAEMIHGGGRLNLFLAALGPRFNPEFVAHHLGDDFDAIVESASDICALDALVQAGMKPLLRNKFYRALVKEREQCVAQSAVFASLADFLSGVGPEFNVALVAHSFGTDNLEEIITQFTCIDDFERLVVAGMKPLHKNKLFRALDVERKRRGRCR